MDERMSLPGVDVVRNRIESIADKSYRMVCISALLWSGRISEVVSKSWGKEKVYGPCGADVIQDYYILGEKKVDCVVFNVKTAKRNGMLRKIALPLDFEPWAQPVFEYFQEFGKDAVFPFSRHEVWRAVVKEAKTFQGLTYPIYKYVVWKDGRLERTVEEHQRSYTLHAIRHSRTTELVEYYGFDGFNLAAYCGWTISTAQSSFGIRTPQVIARYLYLNWQGYFPKLLKRRI